MGKRSPICNIDLGNAVTTINRRLHKHYYDDFKPHMIRLQALPLSHYDLVEQGGVFIVVILTRAPMYSGATLRFNYSDFDVMRVSKYEMHPETHPVIEPKITVHYSQLVPRLLPC